jgi:lipoprotein-anchoring transpeptidase ErfK/SrfK
MRFPYDGAASGPKRFSHDGAASGPKRFSHDGAASGPKPRAPSEPMRWAPITLLSLFFSTAAAAASHSPPWVASGDVPLPAWAKSARVLRADEPIVATPSKNGKKRGSAGREARLPVFAAVQGPGCDGRWLSVGPFAWICDSALELSGNEPVRAGAHTFADPKDGLPFRYYFVGPDGSSAYRRLDAVDVGDPTMQLDAGFAVAVVEEKTFDGGLYGRTSHNLWVPMRDLGPSRPSSFKGETLAPPTAASPSKQADSLPLPAASQSVPAVAGAMPFAWVLPERARLRNKPAGGYTSEGKARFDVVPVLEETPDGRFLRIAPSAWLASADVRRPTVTEPPEEVDSDAGEKWIDVDLATQTLVAYEGKKPVFATLVSTGKGKQGTPSATPTGTYRLWIKLLATDMDNLEDENASRYYRMESVPYVQFFSKGYGLHGAYWHRSFGNVRSHGCVNLAPLDAQRLFWWTAPHLPAGWTATLPMPHEAGTVIRVR